MKWNNRIMNTRLQGHARRADKMRWSLMTGFIFAALLASPLQAAELLSVDHSVGSDNSVSITLSTDGTAADPAVFSTDDPARIVLDLQDTSSNVGAGAVNVSAGRVGQYSTTSAGGRTRLVVDLSEPASYEVFTSGTDVILNISSGASSSSAAYSSAAGSQVRVTNIDFRRGEEGQSRVILSFSAPGANVAVNEQGSRLVVDVLSAEVPSSLRSRLDVVDFATPVQYINTDQQGSGVRMELSVSGAYEHLAYQTGSDFVIEVKEPEVEETLEAELKFFEDKEYTGARVTFNFQDIEVRSVLQLIADVSDLNIVVADSVGGNITLRLTGVPWDQALDIVLDSKNLDMRSNGNVMWIAPIEEIATREQQILQAELDKQQLEPLRTAIITLSYAKATEIKALIDASTEQSLRTVSTTELGLLSGRGSVTVDERTNTLLVNDTQDKIDAIRALVEDLDRAIRQVQIESRIVIARSDFSHELGVRFGVSTVRTSSSSDNILVVGANGSGVDTTFFSLGDDDPDSILLPTQPGRYNVNLPVSNPAGSFALSFLNGDYLLDLELSALESEGQGEVISSPRVITANQAEAFIQQGVEIPYQQSTSSGATNVQFKEAVLELRVTPLITPDNRVQLELAVKQDTVGDVFVLQNGAQIPAIDTRELSTSVLVNNGETVVLGGIYQDESNYTETKVPGLGDLPGIGSLFRNKNTKTEKRELLIFVTPTILDERISVY
jgi:type IV pilus assembly protein PilQ